MKHVLILTLIASAAAIGQPSTYGVRVSSHAPSPVAFAANELARYCESIFDVALKRRPMPDGMGAHTIVLTREGKLSDVPEGLPAAARALGSDGFAVRTFDKQIVFAGGSPRATLFAIYTFLERHVGCRWYYPDPADQIVPKRDPQVLERLIAAGISMSERPDFPFRMREFRDVRPMVEGTDERIIQQIDWWAKLRMNCFLINFGYARSKPLWERWKKRLIPEIKKRGLLLGIGEHGSYPLFLNPSQYASEHPDWYCEIGGHRIGGLRAPNGKGAQFCTTNEAAVRTYLANFVQFAKDNPEIDVYYPAPNDGGLWCQCESCRKLSVADRYLALDNRVAEALVKVRPDYRILHLAYSNHRLPPERTKPHPNVDIDVACWGRDFAYPLSDQRTMPNRKDYLTVFQKWLAICRANRGSRVIYHCKFMRHLWLGFRPMPLQVVDLDMPYLRELGLSGFDLPLGFVGVWTKALNAYVVAHRCWDVDANTDCMVEEYFRLYYGGQADTARQCYEIAADALPDLRYGASRSITWRREYLTPQAHSSSTSLDYVTRAEDGLAKALELAMEAQRAAGSEPCRSRLHKLRTALRQIHREIVFVQKLTSVGRIMSDAEEAVEAEAQRALREQALNLLRTAAQTASELKRSYSLEDDLGGLLWAGSVHDQFAKAVADWQQHAEDLLCGIVWQPVAQWQTQEFPNKDTVISKEIDVTRYLEAPGPVLVRWKWTHGQLGVNIYETSLWEITGEGRRCVGRDRHQAFTGASDRNPVFKLRLEDIRRGARYVVVGRLQARAGHGTVAARGTFGKVALGVKGEAQR